MSMPRVMIAAALVLSLAASCGSAESASGDGGLTSDAAATGQTELMVSTDARILSIAIDGEYAYWLARGSPREVRRIRKNGGGRQEILHTGNQLSEIAVANERLYWVDAVYSVVAKDLPTGAITPLQGKWQMRGLRAAAGYVWWDGSSYVQRADATVPFESVQVESFWDDGPIGGFYVGDELWLARGGSVVRVGPDEVPVFNHVYVDEHFVVKDGYLYVAASLDEGPLADYRLFRVSLSDGRMTHVGNVGGSLQRMLADGEFVYWIASESSQIMRMPLSGGASTEFAATEPGRAVRHLALDAEHVYWADENALYRRAKLAGPESPPLLDAGVEDAAYVEPPRAALSMSSASLDFGSVLVGSTSSEMDLYVTNTGALSSSPMSVGVSGAHASDYSIVEDTCAGTSLGRGFSCVVTLSLTPSAVGTRDAVLAVSADQGGSVSESMGGLGVTSAQISIAPAMHDFGGFGPSQTSPPFTYTVINNGGLPTGLLSVTFTSGDYLDFNIVANNCDGENLAPGASCTVQTQFGPTAPGPRSVTLTVAAAPGGSTDATMSGTGVDP